MRPLFIVAVLLALGAPAGAAKSVEVARETRLPLTSVDVYVDQEQLSKGALGLGQWSPRPWRSVEPGLDPGTVEILYDALRAEELLPRERTTGKAVAWRTFACFFVRGNRSLTFEPSDCANAYAVQREWPSIESALSRVKKGVRYIVMLRSSSALALLERPDIEALLAALAEQRERIKVLRQARADANERFNAARDDREELRGELKEARTEIAARTFDAARAERHVAQLQEELARERSRSGKLLDDNERLAYKHAALEAEFAAYKAHAMLREAHMEDAHMRARAEFAALREAHEELTQKFARQHQASREVIAQLTQVELALADAREMLVSERIAAAERALSRAQVEHRAQILEARMSSMRLTLEAQVRAHQREMAHARKEYERELTDVMAKRDELAREVEAIERELKNTEDERSTAFALVRSLSEENKQLRSAIALFDERMAEVKEQVREIAQETSAVAATEKRQQIAPVPASLFMLPLDVQGQALLIVGLAAALLVLLVATTAYALGARRSRRLERELAREQGRSEQSQLLVQQLEARVAHLEACDKQFGQMAKKLVDAVNHTAVAVAETAKAASTPHEKQPRRAA